MGTITIDKNAIGENLSNYRKRHNLSQDNLAKNLNLTRSAVSAWERGESLPSTEHLMQLCKLYQASADALLGINFCQKTFDEDDNKEDINEQDDDKEDENNQNDDNQITRETEPGKLRRRLSRKYILAGVLIIGAVICAALLVLRKQLQETDEQDDVVPISEMESKEFDITSANRFNMIDW